MTGATTGHSRRSTTPATGAHSTNLVFLSKRRSHDGRLRVVIGSQFDITGNGGSATTSRPGTACDATPTARIRHREPTHDSGLVEPLDRRTALSVQQVANRIVLQPGHVHTIPRAQGCRSATDICTGADGMLERRAAQDNRGICVV